jgi:hypothetical protein
MAQPAMPCRAIISAQAPVQRTNVAKRGGAESSSRMTRSIPRAPCRPRAPPHLPRVSTESQPNQRAPCLRLPPTPCASGPTQAATRSLSEGVPKSPPPGVPPATGSGSRLRRRALLSTPTIFSAQPSPACRAMISSQVPDANDQRCQARWAESSTRGQVVLKASPGGQAGA